MTVNNELLSKLCEPFPASQISTRNIHGRDESWVEQHHLMERLNETLGLDWDWEILSLEVKHVLMGQKDGQQAACHGRLTLHLGDRVVTRDGVGEMRMIGEEARKAAASIAFRHACKFMTTWLWNGEAPESAPSEPVYAPPSEPAPQAKAPEKPPQASSGGWEDDVPDNWGNLMGAVAELTGLERSKFESDLVLHGSKFPDKDDPGRWVTPNMSKLSNFNGLAKSHPKWALSTVSSVKEVVNLLKGGLPAKLQVPKWSGDGITVEEYELSPKSESEEAVPTEGAEVPF